MSSKLITNTNQALAHQAELSRYNSPYRLEIKSQDESYFIYNNNELNQTLRMKCDGYVDDHKLDDVELDKCLSKNNDSPLSKAKLISHLKKLKIRTIEIDTSLYSEMARIIGALKMNNNASKLKFDAVSTADKDSSVSILSDREKSENYAYYYYLTYGGLEAEASIDRPVIGRYDRLLLPFLSSRSNELSTLDYEIIYREIISKKYSQFVSSYYKFDPNNVSSFAMGDFVYPLAMCDLFKNDIKIATDVLSKHHDALTEKQIRILFTGKLVWELLVLKDEDPWQDINACNWSDCNLENKFDEVFENVSYGIKVFNTPIDLPWSWEIASKFHTPIEEQGFGPYQVIFGLFKEAAADLKVRSHFKNVLDDKCFEDDESMLRTIIEKPTFAYALTLDYILTKLTNTVFKNPNVRALPTQPPFINDKVEGRQFAIISATRLLTGNPEWYGEVIDYPHGDNTKYFSFFSFVSDVLYGKESYFFDTVGYKFGEVEVVNDEMLKSGVYYYGSD